MRKIYVRIFALEEILASPALRSLYWVLLIGFYLAFMEWSKPTALPAMSEHHSWLCPPYLTSCGKYNIFVSGSSAYPQSPFFLGLFGILALSAFAAMNSAWVIAHSCLVLLTLFKIIYLYVLNYGSVVEYEYFHIPVVLMFLFARRKLLFARLAFVLTYLLAAAMKFNETWIVGRYFTSLTHGMPFVPDALVPFASNGVAIFELICSWWLLSSSRRLRWTAVGLWTLFHLYSILFIGTTYPSYCLPLLLALFVPDPMAQDTFPRFTKDERLGWSVLAFLLLISLFPYFLPDQNPYVMQGRRYGVQMIDANHQCASEEITIYKDGQRSVANVNSSIATRRCSPYTRLFRISQKCEDPRIDRIQWSFSSSVNGGPFYQLVESDNACALRFSPFRKNSWIRLPQDGAPIKGYPRKNGMSLSGYPVSSIVFDTPDSTMQVPTQRFFEEHVSTIAALYWCAWILSFLIYLIRLKRNVSAY